MRRGWRLYHVQPIQTTHAHPPLYADYSFQAIVHADKYWRSAAILPAAVGRKLHLAGHVYR